MNRKTSAAGGAVGVSADMPQIGRTPPELFTAAAG